MLFVNGKRVNLKEIQTYNGTDEAILLLKETYHQMMKMDFPIKFKSDKMSKGNRPGKSAIWIPFTESIKTDRLGSATITYCDQATGEGLNVKYEPRGMNYTKTLFLGSEDIELIVYLTATCVYIKNGTIKIDNPKVEHEDLAKKREAGSMLSFYLYNEDSPIIEDRELLEQIASALGISRVDLKTTEMLRNGIYDSVEASQKANDETFGYRWFAEAVKGKSANVEILSMVQLAIDKNVVKYNEKTFRWVIIDQNMKEVQTLCLVEPAKVSLRKNILAAFLSNNKEMKETLQNAIDKIDEIRKPKFVEPPPVVTDATDFSTLTFQERKKLCRAKGCPDVMRLKSDELLDWLEKQRAEIVQNPL